MCTASCAVRILYCMLIEKFPALFGGSFTDISGGLCNRDGSSCSSEAEGGLLSDTDSRPWPLRGLRFQPPWARPAGSGGLGSCVTAGDGTSLQTDPTMLPQLNPQ